MKYIYIIVMLMAPVLSLAQNVEFEKGLFKDQKSKFKDAVRDLEEGDKYYRKTPHPLYALAIPHYESAYEFNPDNANLNFKLGICHINSSKKFKALSYFEKAYNLNPKVSPEIHYYLARGLHLAKEWDKAMAEYEIYKRSATLKENFDVIADVNKKISECKYGKKFQAAPARVWIDNMGAEVNTDAPEYAMTMNADATEIYFTSRRPNTTGGRKDEYGRWNEDIYMSQWVNGKWTKATGVGKPLNTKNHNAAMTVNHDATKMILYMDDNGDGNIYESIKKDNEWSKPKKFDDVICSPYHEASATYSGDGKKLYFVSERPADGKKGPAKDKDIYVATWNAEKKKWDNVVPLPATINTKYHEDGVFFHPDGKTMYFSSMGHSSMGGYDIFSTVLQADGSWTTPVNVGYPINTPDDDVFFVVTASGKNAYITSFREDGLGEKDLFKEIGRAHV